MTFVHGLCSDETTRQEMVQSLQEKAPGRYGTGGAVVLKWDTVNEEIQWSPGDGGATPLSSSVFAIRFTAETGDVLENTAIRAKAGQLKAAIDFVKGHVGKPRVILVAHSQGGLEARAYVQGLAYLNRNKGSEPRTYTHDVARIITIDTPHNGSFWALPSLLSGGWSLSQLSSRRPPVRSPASYLSQ